jgi:hypothetical protein
MAKKKPQAEKQTVPAQEVVDMIPPPPAPPGVIGEEKPKKPKRKPLPEEVYSAAREVLREVWEAHTVDGKIQYQLLESVSADLEVSTATVTSWRKGLSQAKPSGLKKLARLLKDVRSGFRFEAPEPKPRGPRTGGTGPDFGITPEQFEAEYLSQV